MNAYYFPCIYVQRENSLSVLVGGPSCESPTCWRMATVNLFCT